MRIKQAKLATAKKLQKLSDDSYLEAELILMHICSLSKTQLLTHEDATLSGKQLDKLENIISQRLKYKPLAYILGYKEFLGENYLVNRATLIPRPETEELVSLVVEAVNTSSNEINRILEIGTGSGCIAVSLARYTLKPVYIEAIDISGRALKVAAANARKILSTKQNLVRFIKKDLKEFKPQKKYDFLVANPPYIKSSELKNLEIQVSWEPMLALDGGPDGLDFYRLIFSFAQTYLNQNGQLFCEINSDLAETTSQLMKKYFPDKKRDLKTDLSGRYRFCHISNQITRRVQQS